MHDSLLVSMELRSTSPLRDEADNAPAGRRPRPSPSPLLKSSTMARPVVKVGAEARLVSDSPGLGEGRATCSEQDLALEGRLPVRPHLHRPDSVITTR